jgi:thiamine-monophosphate kinase
MKLSQIGEFGLIDRIRRRAATGRGVRIGIGDDAAWVIHRRGSSLITADLLIEDIHFRLQWTSLSDLGHKSLAVNLSDIAAMGGTPAYVVLSLGLPARFERRQVDEYYRGLHRLAATSNVALIGGDTNISDRLIISACVIGHPVGQPIRRTGARVGDDLYVTGTLGDSSLGLEFLRHRKKSAERVALAFVLKRHHRPTPRLRAAALLAKHNIPSAMIDVSDGLLQDLGHICAASGVGAQVGNDKLPLSAAYRALAGPAQTSFALSGGEDYELLFSAPARHRPAIAKLQRAAQVKITCIGSIVARRHGITVLDSRGRPITLRHRGHDHFKK